MMQGVSRIGSESFYRYFGEFEMGFASALIVMNVFSPIFDTICEEVLHAYRHKESLFAKIKATKKVLNLIDNVQDNIFANKTSINVDFVNLSKHNWKKSDIHFLTGLTYFMNTEFLENQIQIGFAENLSFYFNNKLIKCGDLV